MPRPRLTVSTRASLVALSALALLSLAHWMRPRHLVSAELLVYLLGVLPNLAAVIAITFVLLAGWIDQHPTASPGDMRRRCRAFALFATAGLIVWEVGQLFSRSLRFDYHDIAATLLGLGASWTLNAWVIRGAPGRQSGQ